MVKTGSLLLIVDLVFGAFLLNKGLGLIALPEIITPQIENVIFIIAGGLLALAGFMSMKQNPVYRR